MSSNSEKTSAGQSKKMAADNMDWLDNMDNMSSLSYGDMPKPPSAGNRPQKPPANNQSNSPWTDNRSSFPAGSKSKKLPADNKSWLEDFANMSDLGADNEPGKPVIDNTSNWPGLDNIPGFDNMSKKPSAGGMSKFPGLDKMLNLPGLDKMSEAPSAGKKTLASSNSNISGLDKMFNSPGFDFSPNFNLGNMSKQPSPVGNKSNKPYSVTEFKRPPSDNKSTVPYNEKKLAVYNAEKPAADKKKSDLTTEQQAALDKHNEAREAKGLKPLEWHPDLAKQAEKYAKVLAEKKAMQHSSTPGQGENLAWYSGDVPLEKVVADFLTEEKDYHGKPVLENETYAQFKKYAHYTQIVWDKTTHVGMSKAKAKDGSTFVVARYFPQGNIQGQKPF